MYTVYTTSLYTDTSNVIGIDTSQNNTDLTDFQNNRQASAKSCVQVELPSQSPVISKTYTQFSALVACPYTWSHVNYVTASGKITLYLITSKFIDISDRSKRYIGINFLATKNTSTSVMIKAPGSMSYTAGPLFQNNLTNDRLVFGGWAWGENIVNGDYLKVDVVDHDNVLGAGVDYVLKGYGESATISVYPTSGDNAVSKITGIYLHPDQMTEIKSSNASRLYGGMWLRFTYVSVGTVSDPKLWINLDWEKQNS